MKKTTSKNFGFISSISLLALSSQIMAVNISDHSSDNRITPAEFNRAQDAAGNGGIINFGRGNYTIDGTLVLTKSNLTISGIGSNGTILTRNTRGRSANGIFITGQDGTTIQNMTLRGDVVPTYVFDLYEREGSAVQVGLERGIRVANGANNPTFRNINFLQLSVGVEYETGRVPSGLRVLGSRFETGRGMVVSEAAGVDRDLAVRMLLRNLRFTFRPGQGNRGLTFDYGNGDQTSPVNFRNSVVTRCVLDRMAFFSVDFNRAANVRIINNPAIDGGGRGTRSGFVHALHFEDTGRNILIENNTIRQQTVRNDNNQVLNSRSFIWSGGNNGATQAIVRNNRFIGSVNNAIVGGGRAPGGGLFNWTITGNTFDITNLNNNDFGNVVNGFRSPSTARISGNTLNGSNGIPANLILLRR